MKYFINMKYYSLLNLSLFRSGVFKEMRRIEWFFTVVLLDQVEMNF